jgi:recombination protein RecR
VYYPEPLAELIEEFRKMPTIGPKSAERLAFYLLEAPQVDSDKLTAAIKRAKSQIKHCSICHNLTEQEPCAICSDPSRDESLLCVTATPKDIIALEKTHEFKGRYHVLGGVIAPLDDVSPDKLRIKELLARVKQDNVKEVVMVINPTVEGEATMIYISQLLKPLGVKTSRIAYGLPVGGDIDYADELTLSRALSGRQPVD